MRTRSPGGLGDEGGWVSFDCSGSKRWRYLADGRAEIEGEGSPVLSWPAAVDQWHEPVERAAAQFGVPAAWIAAIMAIESGGKAGQCRKKADGTCSSSEGVGLMAIMAATATIMAGRPVSSQELLTNNELNIELGSKYLKYHLDQYGGDPVKASVGYNAGKVRCGQGTVFGPSDELCPRTDWNVVEGCVTAPRDYQDLVCAPSSEEAGKYVCSIDRPRQFIKALNAAIGAGWPGQKGPYVPPKPEPLPGTEEERREHPKAPQWLAMLAGAAAGYLLVWGVRYGADLASGRARLPAPLRRARGAA